MKYFKNEQGEWVDETGRVVTEEEVQGGFNDAFDETIDELSQGEDLDMGPTREEIALDKLKEEEGKSRGGESFSFKQKSNNVFDDDEALENLKEDPADTTTGDRIWGAIQGGLRGAENFARRQAGQYDMVQDAGAATADVMDSRKQGRLDQAKRDPNSAKNKLFRETLAKRSGIPLDVLESAGITIASDKETLAQIQQEAQYGREDEMKAEERSFQSSVKEADRSHAMAKAVVDAKSKLMLEDRKSAIKRGEKQLELDANREAVRAYARQFPGEVSGSLPDGVDAESASDAQISGAIESIKQGLKERTASKGKTSISINSSTEVDTGGMPDVNPGTLEESTEDLQKRVRVLREKAREAVENGNKVLAKQYNDEAKEATAIISKRLDKRDAVGKEHAEILSIGHQMRDTVLAGRQAAKDAPELFQDTLGSWVLNESDDFLNQFRAAGSPPSVRQFRQRAKSVLEDFARERSGAAIGEAEMANFRNILLGNGSLADLERAYNVFRDRMKAQLKNTRDNTSTATVDTFDATTNSPAKSLLQGYKDSL